MKHRLALAAVFALTAQSAFALTVTFGDGTGTMPYSEGGFVFTQTVGGAVQIPAEGGDGYLSLGITPLPNVGDTVEVVKTGGGTFTFDSFELIGPGIAASFDSLNVYGFLGGSMTQQLLGVTPTSGSYVADPFATGFSAAVDKISFVMAAVANESTRIDNLVFDAPAVSSDVPLPAGLPLLVAGLAGLAAVRRRSAKV